VLSKELISHLELCLFNQSCPNLKWRNKLKQAGLGKLITFHLQQMFHYDADATLKYYIMKTLKKPNRVLIHQFFVQVAQLNSYLKMLPCLYYSPNANQATKQVLPLDDADLMT
jgi:hypothetical protein